MRLLLLGTVLALGGCGAVADIAGLAVGAAAGSATANPAVGYAVGLGVRAGVDELQRYVSRSRQHGEQDAIATAAGTEPLGRSRAWEIRHTIPIGNQRGTLTVVREIPNPLAPCREVLFSADQELFLTPVCFGEGAWHWAAAEPATERWGTLQH